jgi:formylmethanofuran dehydrogenase subunit E
MSIPLVRNLGSGSVRDPGRAGLPDEPTVWSAIAAMVMTGITAGRRRLKFKDYGKAAISFLDLVGGGAFRVAARKEPHPGHDVSDAVAFRSQYADEQIMDCREATITLPPGDLPGRPPRRVTCQNRGEDVMDKRDVTKDGKILRGVCAGDSCYHPFGRTRLSKRRR